MQNNMFLILTLLTCGLNSNSGKRETPHIIFISELDVLAKARLQHEFSHWRSYADPRSMNVQRALACVHPDTY